MLRTATAGHCDSTCQISHRIFGNAELRRSPCKPLIDTYPRASELAPQFDCPIVGRDDLLKHTQELLKAEVGTAQGGDLAGKVASGIGTRPHTLGGLLAAGLAGLADTLLTPGDVGKVTLGLVGSGCGYRNFQIFANSLPREFVNS